jgi:hypothetical protein
VSLLVQFQVRRGYIIRLALLLGDMEGLWDFLLGGEFTPNTLGRRVKETTFLTAWYK